jgi:hypothetical protein
MDITSKNPVKLCQSNHWLIASDPHISFIFHFIHCKQNKQTRKFSTTDILVPITMKNAAKCDTQCELQNSASHQIFERNWRRFIGMSVSVC